MRILARWGMPLQQAKMFCEVVLVPRIEESLNEVFMAETPQESDERAHLETLVFYAPDDQEGQEDYQYRVFLEGKLIPLEGDRVGMGDEPEPDLLTWLRQEALSDVLVIVPGLIAFSLGSLIQEVRQYRHEKEWWRSELRRFMQGFKEGEKPPTSFEQSVREALASGLRPDELPKPSKKKAKGRRRK